MNSKVFIVLITHRKPHLQELFAAPSQWDYFTVQVADSEAILAKSEGRQIMNISIRPPMILRLATSAFGGSEQFLGRMIDRNTVNGKK